MGRPSKSRSGSGDTSTVTDARPASPVNLSFHAAAAAPSSGARAPPSAPAADRPAPAGDAAQQPDSTADRCPPPSRKRPAAATAVNVLRQLQSSSVAWWPPAAAVDLAADLRVKRARHSGAKAAVPGTAGWRWTAAEPESCVAVAGRVYDEAALGSPSVTSSGRRDSVDDDDDDDDDEDLMVSRHAPARQLSTTDSTERPRPRISADRKLTGTLCAGSLPKYWGGVGSLPSPSSSLYAPSPPAPPTLSSLFFLSPLKSRSPHIQLGRLGSAVSSPNGAGGGAPAEIEFSAF